MIVYKIGDFDMICKKFKDSEQKKSIISKKNGDKPQFTILCPFKYLWLFGTT